MVKIHDATIDDVVRVSEFVSALSVVHVAPSLGDGGLARLLASMDVASTTQRILDGLRFPFTKSLALYDKAKS